MHKLSELSFLIHYLLVLILLLQGLLFGSISNATAINARTYNVLIFIISLRIWHDDSVLTYLILFPAVIIFSWVSPLSFSFSTERWKQSYKHKVWFICDLFLLELSRN